jgi:rRNA maturation endonuclease Nob1
LVWRDYDLYVIPITKLKKRYPPVKVEKISVENKERVHSNPDYAEHLVHYNKVVEEIKSNKSLIRLLHDEMMQIKNKVLGSSTEKFWI